MFSACQEQGPVFKAVARLTVRPRVRLVRQQALKELLAGHLSKLVNLRADRKPISDARTATYMILSTSSEPGGRWFQSIRPDQLS